MGASHSTKRKGGIIMDFDKPFYYTGEEVQGSVYLNLKENFATRGLEISYEVIEYTSFWDRSSHDQYRYHKIHKNHYKHHCENHLHRSKYNKIIREGRKILFKNSSIINSTKISVGQYVFPFKLQIPFNLPGSFEYYDRDNLGYIKHQISARLISLDEPENDIFNSTILMVRQAPRYFEYPAQLSDTKNIYSWCCFPRGHTTMTISYAKDFFSPDETVQVICDLDNTRCGVDAIFIKLELFQRITLKDNFFHTLYLTRKIAEQRYDGVYVKKCFNYFFNINFNFKILIF
jgi:hypothetical protein